MKFRRVVRTTVLFAVLALYQNCTSNSGGGAFNLNSGNGNNASSMVPYTSPTPTTSPTPSATPVPSATPAAVAIAATYGSTCAIVDEAGTNSVECWGSNSSGGLGQSPTTLPSSLKAVTVPGSTGATQIFAHRGATCATVNGNALCWGTNNDGILGNGLTTGNGPVQPTGLPSGVVKVLVGYEHACALVQPGGKIYCWGGENFGELGNGTQFDSAILPFLVFTGASDLAINDETTCAVASGSVYCWGSNWYGGAGQANYPPEDLNSNLVYMEDTPTRLPGFSGDVAALSSGTILESAICALLTDNVTVYCWGGGSNSGVDSAAPVYLFTATSTVTKLVGHQESSGTGAGSGACAVMSGGSVLCKSFQGTLQTLAGLDMPVIDFSDNSSGGSGLPYSGCSVSAGGTAQCWGIDSSGELGTGATSSTVLSTPQTVTVLQ